MCDQIFERPLTVYTYLIHMGWTNPLEQCIPLLMLFLQPIKKFRFVHTEFLRNTRFTSAIQRFALLALGRAWILFGSRKNSKPEKYLKMGQNPQRRVHHERARLIFHTRNRPAILQSILPKDRTKSRTKQWRHANVAAPRCTVVTGQIDLYTGGKH